MKIFNNNTKIKSDNNNNYIKMNILIIIIFKKVAHR